MSNATRATPLQLAKPSVERDGNDLVVSSADGQREWQIRNYFFNVPGHKRSAKLSRLNFPVELERHPPSGGDFWTLGRSGDDVMVGADFDLNFSGHGGDDVLLAGAGTDYLDGGAGNDWLYAGAGNDDLLGDIGNDRLYGEAGDDRLQGGEGNDRLFGGGGDDRLYGGKGNDRLGGGRGDDMYVFQRGDGQDRIFNGRSDGELDVVQFAGDIAADQLWFRKIGQDLQVSVVGTDDSVTIAKWYADDAQRVDRFDLIPDAAYHAHGTRSLDMDKVEALVQAMSAFTPPAAGSTSLPADYEAALRPVLAANWN